MEKQIEFSIESHLKKIKLLSNYTKSDFKANKLSGDLTLIRANNSFISNDSNDDYGLNQVFI